MTGVEHSATRRLLLDAGSVGIALVGVWLALWTNRPVLGSESPAWWWVDLAGGLLAAALLLARRRYPVAVAVTLSALEFVVVTAWLAGLVATFALAFRRPWPVAVGVTVVGLVATPLDGLVRDRTAEAASWSTLGQAVVIAAAVIASGMAVRARHALLASLVERAERAESEAALRADAARTAERTRIAREMHDVLAHRLSLVSMHAGALAHRRTASPDEVRDALEVVRAGASDALADLRAILGVLRDPDTAAGTPGRDVEPAGRPPQPTLADLDHLLEGVRATGTTVRLHDELGTAHGRVTVPDDCARTLYRIAQEALTNAARHAPGQPVDVVLRGTPGHDAELDVSNPLAPGAHSRDGAGTGLLGVAERVTLAGGRVLAQGPEHDRFRVAVRVPWPEGAA